MENDIIYFKLKCGMPRRWIPAFISMLKRMEEDGRTGHSEIVGMLCDGAGDFKPHFTSRSPHMPAEFNPPIPSLYNVGHTIFDADMDRERFEQIAMTQGMDVGTLQGCAKVTDDGWLGKKLAFRGEKTKE